MVTTMADLDMSKDFDYSRCDKIIYTKWERHNALSKGNYQLTDIDFAQC